MRTQVAIIGAGPSGLLLGQLLYKAGIDNIIIEQRSADYVLGRIRAGVLEQVTVDLLKQAGADKRMNEEGLPHDGIELLFKGKRHRINLHDLTGGKRVMVYGQTEVTRDLMEVRAQEGLTTVYEASHVQPVDFESDKPKVRYEKDGQVHEIECDFIAGCDGFHGICRASAPQDKIKTFEKVYPFGWLGLLGYAARVARADLCQHRTRLCPVQPAQRHAQPLLSAGASDRQGRGLERRSVLGRAQEAPGPRSARQSGDRPLAGKSIAPLRSFVTEPMRFGRMFLAGDAAHIVPPTGAKGLNLAASDVGYLSQAFVEYYQDNSEAGIDRYSEQCLRRVWKAERFSWWMTSMLHNFPGEGEFNTKVQEAELDYIVHSEAGSTSLAENYVGLPLV